MVAVKKIVEFLFFVFLVAFDGGFNLQSSLPIYSDFDSGILKVQIEKALINDRFRVSKVS